MPSQLCLVCCKRDKKNDAQFCSDVCKVKVASKKEPQLLRVPKDHTFYVNLKKQFANTWSDKYQRLPIIAKIYLITWPKGMRDSFEKYRDAVAKARNIPKGKAKEVKCWRSERRACRLGDTKPVRLCQNSHCRLCAAIKTGLKSSLDNKRGMVKAQATGGIRFGGGVYMSKSSSKAFEYSKDLRGGSQYTSVLATRTVLGRINNLQREDHHRLGPGTGYDSVSGRAEGGGPLEHIVYNKDAVRPAYLILLKKH